MSDLNKAAEGVVTAEHAHEGQTYRFGKLTMRDLASIQAGMPDKSATFGAVWMWLNSPAGRLAAIVTSAQKFHPVFTEGAADEFGIDVCHAISEKIIDASYGSLIVRSAEGNGQGAKEATP